MESMRIIPARAGFTPPVETRWTRPTDHPRSRGVYGFAHSKEGNLSGSSPLARGLLLRPRTTGRAQRIIPARAGFTMPGKHASGKFTDHPRSRGVYRRAPPRGSCSPGSSPLARGLRPDRYSADRMEGIIPARAGFTPACSTRSPWPRDHPRSRGVYHHEQLPTEAGGGSSPLARGLHLRILGIPTTRHPTRLRLPSLPT